ncbi:MAG: STAS domain-containing protein [Planctomycetota bacterium]|jgi:anti-anti-sigma factor
MTEDDIFKKLVIANRYVSETDCMVLLKTANKLRAEGKKASLLKLALGKKKITENQASRLSKAIKYNLLRYNDKTAVKLMIDDGLLTAVQYDRFAQKQSQIYKLEKRIVSILEIMKESGLLSSAEVNSYKAKSKKAVQAKGEEKKAAAAPPQVQEESGRPPEKMESGPFTVSYREESMDFNGNPVYMSVIEAIGSIDSHTSTTFDKMCKAVFAMAGDRGRFVIMDLTGVSYMSSSGIGSVIGWKKEAQDRGGDIKFIGIQPDVIGVFEMLGVKDTLHICDSVSDAFWAFVKFL